MSYQPFAAMDDISSLVSAFEQCQLTPDEFHHREHLAVAFWYCRKYDESATLPKMRDSLHNFLSHHGLKMGYHETITAFWILMVRRFIKDSGKLAELQIANNLINEYGGGEILKHYYSSKCLGREAARQSWQLPDLQAL